MASEARDDVVPEMEEAAEEEEVVKLEEEVEQMAQKILDYRTTLPPQLSSTISSLLQSQRPVLPTHLLDTESGASQGLSIITRSNGAIIIICGNLNVFVLLLNLKVILRFVCPQHKAVVFDCKLPCLPASFLQHDLCCCFVGFGVIFIYFLTLLRLSTPDAIICDFR